MVALELEVLAKKLDRFGWERDRGSAAHDRIVSDWMDALQDYPLGEVKDACREWVTVSPRKMPNEGDILGLIGKARRTAAARFKASNPQPEERPRERVTAEAAARILKNTPFQVKRFPK